VRFDPREIRRAVSDVEGFNAKLALAITRSVGTMACAYVFAAIALISLCTATEFADTGTTLDRLDVNTPGGIRDLLDAIYAIGNPAGASQTFPTAPTQSKG
jgi:hypothetical protein